MDRSADPLSAARAAFDRVAPEMDSVTRRNRINAWMREVSLEWIRSTFRPGARLLDLGCGSGADAVTLATGGYAVVAVDVSPAMIERARENARHAGVSDRVSAECGRMVDLPRILGEPASERFDGAYANFSLTYEPDLRAVFRSVHRYLAPDARFVCTLPNRFALSELLVYGPQLRFGKFLVRVGASPRKDVWGISVPIRTYSPAMVAQEAEGTFEVLQRVGVPTIVPPPYLHLQFARLGNGRELVKSADRWFGPRPPWNRWGDHTLFVLRRLSD